MQEPRQGRRQQRNRATHQKPASQREQHRLTNCRIRNRSPTSARRAADKCSRSDSDRRDHEADKPEPVGRGRDRVSSRAAVIKTRRKHCVRQTDQRVQERLGEYGPRERDNRARKREASELSRTQPAVGSEPSPIADEPPTLRPGTLLGGIERRRIKQRTRRCHAGIACTFAIRTM